MIMEQKKLLWSDVPADWALCFNNDCPMAEHCLRRRAAGLAPRELTVAQALADGQCRYYASTEPVRYARGFKHIYDMVRKADYTSMRVTITGALSGCRLYYDYMNGRRALSPEQQEMIRGVFRSYGYDEDVQFDAYEYDFRYPRV